ncbi:hypothetical protein NZK33_10350 [Cyanobium sp. FGCU-6]|jgi:hypothetical protein|nr:hypothetical protein [Cyanobium sp. FGCU6]
MINPAPIPPPAVPVPQPPCREQASPAAPSLSEAPGPSPSIHQPTSREPVLCGHCGRTAGNGITCQGMCVADSGY